jgi:hypothetical protein
MSIKTIDADIQSNIDGVSKRINKGAEKMVFDILQATQYSNPIPSTIRELVTNACDSQREKEIAIEILTGVKTEEDYFIRRDGEQYSDSNFNPDYYDLNCLNQDTNDIIINYYRNEGIGYCDKIEIIDCGVGIGGKRLEGVLELGYSTKRNTSQNFGAFGLGAKVALSTGVDFYTIETVHNGKKFKCNCYPYKTDFIIPQFNPYIEFSDGTKVHYEETEEKNYTIVSFGVKKHNRSRFEESVQDQLNYLHNVKLFIHEDGTKWEKSIHNQIIHNSDSIIVTNSSIYNKPHIVVVKDVKSTAGINYGYVDFRELEMEQLYGSVGLKCPVRQSIKNPETGEEIVIQDGVEVTPSREKVIWNEPTKLFIQGVIKNAALEATNLVEEQLQEDDFLKWLQACRDVLHKSSNNSNSALRQISKIIDTEDIKPKYPKDSAITFIGPKALFKGLHVREVIQSVTKSGKVSITSEAVTTWLTFNFDAVFIKDSETPRDRAKDTYLTEQFDRIIIIEAREIAEFIADDLDATQAAKLLHHRNKIFGYLEKSELTKSYEDVVVPDEYRKALANIDEFLDKVDESKSLTPSQKRELESRVVAYSIRIHENEYVWDKVEPKLSTLLHSEKITYYGSSKDGDKLMFAASVLKKFNINASHLYHSLGYWYNQQYIFYVDYPQERFKGNSRSDKELPVPQLLKVSEDKLKYLEQNPNCKHIDTFFYDYDSNRNTITMDHHLVKWITGRSIKTLPNWLNELDFISLDYPKMYELLDEYKTKYAGFPDGGHSDIVELIDKFVEFQTYCESVNYDDTLVANKSRELFIFTDIKAVEAFDSEIVKLARTKDEFIEGIHHILDNLRFPYYKDEDFKKEIEHYIKSRGKLDIEINLPQV